MIAMSGNLTSPNVRNPSAYEAVQPHRQNPSRKKMAFFQRTGTRRYAEQYAQWAGNPEFLKSHVTLPQEMIAGGKIMISKTPQQGFLRLPQVLALIPVSKSTWWDGCKSGRYPQPVKIGPNSTAWKAEDITELMQRLANPEEPQQKAGK